MNLDEESINSEESVDDTTERYIIISNRLKNKLYRPKKLHKLYLFLYLDNENPLYLECLDPMEISILNSQLNLIFNLLFPTWNNLQIYLINIHGELLPIIYFLEKEYLDIFYKLVKNKNIKIDIFDLGHISVKCTKDIIQRYLVIENY
jgi:hypothetical protein